MLGPEFKPQYCKRKKEGKKPKNKNLLMPTHI
jgi:hypothetical protein